jgi:hypothetical protein
VLDWTADIRCHGTREIGFLAFHRFTQAGNVDKVLSVGELSSTLHRSPQVGKMMSRHRAMLIGTLRNQLVGCSGSTGTSSKGQGC